MTPLTLMIAIVEQYIYRKKGVRVSIRITTDRDLQLLGRAYYYILNN